MPMDFPSSPTVGQQYNGYVWDGTAWDSTSAQPISLSTTAPGYNYIINGGMDIAQRGTTTVTSNDLYGALDRWRSRTVAVGGSVTTTQVASGLTGIQNAMRFQRVAGNTNTSGLQAVYTSETIMSTPLAGKTITLSFYARKGANFSPSASNISAIIGYGTGTDQYWGSFTGFTQALNQSTVLTTSWQRFNYTATFPTTMTQFYVMFDMSPTGTAGANDYFELTGVQLEEGAAATAFRRNAPSIQGELAACQRYYQRFTLGPIGQGSYYNTTQVMAYVAFQTKMRTSVSTTIDASTLVARHFSGGTVGLNSIAVEASDTGVLVFGTAASGTRTANDAVTLYIGSSGYLGLSAEL